MILFMNDLPMKRRKSEQFNLRIGRELRDDIEFLDRAGVQVSELVRPELERIVQGAKKKIENKAG